MGEEAHHPSVSGRVEEQLNATAFEVVERHVVPRPRILRERPSSIKVLGPNSILDSASASEPAEHEVWKWWTELSLKDIYENSHNRLPKKVQVFSLMEHLPIELRRAVIRQVDIPSLKSLRLTSKAWADLGEEYLISSVFTSLPHCPDIPRLQALSQHSSFKHRVRSLILNHGELNEYHARHNTYFLQYMREPESRLEAQTSAWGTYTQIKEEKERYLPTSCETNTLTTIFGRLPNLMSIEVTLTTCPFEEEGHPELLKDIWRIPSSRLLPRVATTERFTNVLTAISSNVSTIRIENLSHDRLPFEFFAQKAIVNSLLSTAFQSLTTLKLAIDYSDMPNNLHSPQAFQNLSHCLRAAASLQCLDFAFEGRKKIDISPLLSSFKEADHRFSSLVELTLKGIISTEIELGGFLTAQESLKILQLGGLGVRAPHQPSNGGLHLKEGSFRGLFGRLRTGLDLKELRIQGDLVAVESGERWVLDHVELEERLREYVID
jgi:hypothetical protein